MEPKASFERRIIEFKDFRSPVQTMLDSATLVASSVSSTPQTTRHLRFMVGSDFEVSASSVRFVLVAGVAEVVINTF